MKLTITHLALAFVLALLAGTCHGATATAGEQRSITDMCGNRIDVPVYPRRIASLPASLPTGFCRWAGRTP